METTPDLSERLVAALNQAYGAHPGRRAAHARGFCCSGDWTPTREAALISRAAHFQARVPVTVRFSSGSGDPGHPDTYLDARGMAVKFRLRDGEETDIVALNQPVFFVRTPEDFLEFMAARRPDSETGRPDRERIEGFVAAHPESAPAIFYLLSTPAARSYAQQAYHGIHAFRFDAPGGAVQFGRYRWEPEAGVATLSSEERRRQGPDYLREELTRRLAEGPAYFRLQLQLAGAADSLTDPTLAWPDERPLVPLGRLRIEAPAGDQEAGCEQLVFDPARVVDGIVRSDDPILLARPGAYSVSIRQRLNL